MQKITVKVEEAAEMLSISRTAMYGLLSDQSIRSVKLGKSRLVVVESITAYIASLPTDGLTQPSGRGDIHETV